MENKENRRIKIVVQETSEIKKIRQRKVLTRKDAENRNMKEKR